MKMSNIPRERIVPNTFDISDDNHENIQSDHVPETGITREEYERLGGIPVVRTQSLARG